MIDTGTVLHTVKQAIGHYQNIHVGVHRWGVLAFYGDIYIRCVDKQPGSSDGVTEVELHIYVL